MDNIESQDNIVKEREERIRREDKFASDYPDGFSRLGDEINALKQYGLYCGVCGHGLGCEHGVPSEYYI